MKIYSSAIPDTDTFDIVVIGAGGAGMSAANATNAFWAPVSLRKRADGSTAAFPHFVMDRAKPGMLTVNSAGKRQSRWPCASIIFG